MNVSRKYVFHGKTLVLLALVGVLFDLPAGAVSRPNVLLITVDTLRADHLGCYGYKLVQTPNIDRLAAEGVRFKTVVAQVPLTLPSHCSILTGTYPMLHQVRDNVGYRLDNSTMTLAEMLKPFQYQTGAVVGAYVLDAKFGINQGFDFYDSQFEQLVKGKAVINLNQVERPAEEVINRSIKWLVNGHPPFFLWVHLYDPHDPYSPPAPFKVRYAKNPYDGEIAYTDQQLGRLLAFLREKNLYDNTIVILVGDHGESFGEHKEWTHGFFVYDSTLLVPWILKPLKGALKGQVVSQQVRLVDVVPTVLQMLEIPKPATVQGTGLLGLLLGKSGQWPGEAYAETYYPTKFGWSPLATIRRPDSKFIRSPKAELYDLRRDPAETLNRFQEKKALADELKAQLTRIETAFTDQTAIPGATLKLTAQDLEKLGALGYVGTAGSRGVVTHASIQAPDPKDKLPAFQLIGQAGQDVAAGQYERALPTLKKVLQMEPGMPSALTLQGRCYFQLARYGPARKCYQEILSRQPDNLNARFQMAACDYFLKDLTASEAGLKKVLEQDRNFADAHRYLGFLYQSQGKNSQALSSFQRVLELDAEDEDAHAKTGFLLASEGHVKEAVPHFQKVIQLNPRDGEARFNLGVAYLKLKQEELARQELAEACRLDRRYCREPK